MVEVEEEEVEEKVVVEVENEIKGGRMIEATQEIRLTRDRGPVSPSNPPIPQ